MEATYVVNEDQKLPSFLRFWRGSSEASMSSRFSINNYGESKRHHSTNGSELPGAAEIVVAGGGILGSSVAYHLAKFGKKDVVVLEQGSLGCGTTWHSVGLLGRLRENELLYNMTSYGFELYSNLEEDSGLSTGIKKCGSLLVSHTKDREISFRRLYDRVRLLGLECELLSPRDAQKLYPALRIDDLGLAVWSPNEGALNASDACSSLMRGATNRGVRFFDGVGIKRVCTNGRRVIGVETERGYIHCEKFINCSGQWARELGLRTDPPVNMPLHSCEHFYIVTKPMEGVHSMLPVLRDYDAYIYVREWSGGLLVGGFEPIGKPCFYEKGVPDKFEFQLLQEDWNQFDILMKGALHRIPSLENAEIRQFVNGPESFTPDGKYLFGEVPEVDNYFVACGMCSAGVMGAPGMGRLTAELVTEGSCSWDTTAIDIKRLTKEQNNKLFLRDRVRGVLGQQYKIAYPDAQISDARPLKASPLYDILTMNGADWGEIGGWERARWFNKYSTEHRGSFGKPSWFSHVEEEFNACKRHAGISDMSWQSKFEITGHDTQELINEMQHLFAVNIDLPVGSSVRSALLNHSGHYVAVVDIHRLSDSRFLLVTPPDYHNHVLSWISKNSKFLRIEDITPKYACIGIFGPEGIGLLQNLTLTPLDGFSIGENKVVDLGNASGVILNRRNLGDYDVWYAFIPIETCRSTYKSIDDTGSVKNIGHYAINALRIDAGVPEMGADIGSFSSPASFGSFSFVNPSKDSQFIGKEAIRKRPSDKSLFSLTFECDDDNWAWGGEPVYVNGETVGTLASVSFSFSRNKMVGLSVLPTEKVSVADQFVVRIAGQDKLLELKDICAVKRINALRIDAGVPEMGADIGSFSSPASFGSFSFVNPIKDTQFIGKEAIRKRPSDKSLFSLTFECDDDNWAWGGEPVYVNGETVGTLASVSFSFSRNKMVGLSVLPTEKVSVADQFVVRIAGQDKLLELKDICAVKRWEQVG